MSDQEDFVNDNSDDDEDLEDVNLLLNCDVPEAPDDTKDFGELDSNGGVFVSRRDETLTAGVTLTLSLSLTIVVAGKLTIEGKILRDKSVARPINITLVSVNDDVVIEDGAEVGAKAPPVAIPEPTDGPPEAPAGVRGTNAGFIKITAPQGSIAITGKVAGFRGADGGDVGLAAGILFFIVSALLAFFRRLFGFRGNLGTTFGGNGGAGGDVQLCAMNNIDIDQKGLVLGGYGGAGGDHSVRSLPQAVAKGGRGGRGGAVVVVGLKPMEGTNFSNQGQVRAGSGGNGGDATARANPTNEAMATGGDGGPGGLVRFRNILSGRRFTGFGGDGGNATAIGGDGQPGADGGPGGPGGDATATGGSGGRQGIGGIPVGLTSPKRSKGGDAKATAGNGGDGGGDLRRGTGGPSGRSTARGGFASTADVKDPVRGGPAPNGAGGQAKTADSPGAVG